VDKLTSFVAYKTVSSDPRYRTECRRGASFLRTVFKAFGARTEVLSSDDPDINPVILAVFKRNSKTTARKTRILFYGHYDVIPADQDDGKWISNPFQVEGVDEYVYGRGTSDNKGPLLAAIYAVAGLLAQKSLEADVVFLVEGEEECGSRGFEDVVRKYKPMVGPVDWILVANSYWLDDHVPCLTYGLRGVIHATLKVTSDRPDVHSGVDGSSLLDESLKDLVLLLNSLVGDKGAVKLPAFYDPVLPMSKLEAALYNDITSALVENNPQIGDKEELAKKLKQKWREASLTIHRFGTSGPGNSTIIPRMAWVSISLRLVPNQEADKIADDLVTYLEEEFRKLRSSNHFQISIDRKAEPWLGDFNNAMYRTLEEGIMRAWSTEGSFSGRNTRRPLYIREGGSIPAIRFLEKEFDAPAAHMPCGQASDNAHLDNERLRLVNLYKSRDVFQWVFKELPRRVE
jgi:di- and tripeptidase